MASKPNKKSRPDAQVPPIEKPNKNKGLIAKKVDFPLAHQNPGHAIRHANINGVEMGILSDGTPYLSELGLAQFCGIDQSTLNEMSLNWAEERLKPRGRQIEVLLNRLGHAEPTLYRKSVVNGTEINAYVETACMAILEHYAFNPRDPKQRAIDNFRTLARFKFREFVYDALGYKPKDTKADAWQQYHDRVDLTQFAVEFGYFCVFNEIAPIMVPLISDGVGLGKDVVLDISIGIAWSKYWVDNNLEAKYGARKRYEHFYPDYFPQAKSNPQEPYAYPDAALAEFRRWLRAEYVVKKLPTYLTSQAKMNKISHTAAINATLALTSNSRVTGRQLGTK